MSTSICSMSLSLSNISMDTCYCCIIIMLQYKQVILKLFHVINHNFTILSPGIGVPILLAYVYGVVPISLCRSGGCGVTTTNKGGVKFEFDENETAGTQSVYTGMNKVYNGISERFYGKFYLF